MATIFRDRRTISFTIAVSLASMFSIVLQTVNMDNYGNVAGTYLSFLDIIALLNSCGNCFADAVVVTKEWRLFNDCTQAFDAVNHDFFFFFDSLNADATAATLATKYSVKGNLYSASSIHDDHQNELGMEMWETDPRSRCRGVKRWIDA